MSEVTVQEFETLAKNMAELRGEIELDKRALQAKQEALEELEAKATDMLKTSGKSSYAAEAGTIYISERLWAQTPKTQAEKEALLEYFRQKGLYWDFISVNSSSLNAFVKQEWEQVKDDPEKALEFKIPGLSEIKMKETLGFRSKK